MELGLCLSLGLALARKTRLWLRIALLLPALACIYGVVISQSRGGGFTIILVAAATLLWGFYAWRPKVRWLLRGAATLASILIIVLGIFLAHDYIDRFKQWHTWNPDARNAELTLKQDLTRRFWLTSRGRMIGGALRAWKSEPVWGIGPGMHANVWFHFACSDDGDRESGKRPSIDNHSFHSYEVHSDWVQLLEEYGIVGLSLALIAFLTFIALFWHRLITLAPPRDPPAIIEQAAPLAALLSLAALGFHSLGDFNLQIPANTWTLALIVAAGLSTTLTQRQRPRPTDDDD